MLLVVVLLLVVLLVLLVATSSLLACNPFSSTHFLRRRVPHILDFFLTNWKGSLTKGLSKMILRWTHICWTISLSRQKRATQARREMEAVEEGEDTNHIMVLPSNGDGGGGGEQGAEKPGFQKPKPRMQVEIRQAPNKHCKPHAVHFLSNWLNAFC